MGFIAKMILRNTLLKSVPKWSGGISRSPYRHYRVPALGPSP